jgi:hypothetical protein
MDMQQAVSARAPAHLWAVGILALLWNGYACFDYLMTNLHNQDYLAQMPADQMAYWQGLPSWLTAFWALGVWGGLLGAVMLLVRSRYAVHAFALSLLGVVVNFGYMLAATEMPSSMKSGAMELVPWVIFIVALILLWYAARMSKAGVLR